MSNYHGWRNIKKTPIDAIMNMILNNHNVISANSDDWLSEHIGTDDETLIVLDFGCGIGRNSFPLAELHPNWTIIGYDNPEMIEQANLYCKLKYNKLKSEYSNLEFTSDWERVKNIKFNCTLSILVFQHIFEDDLSIYLTDLKKITDRLVVSGRRFNDDVEESKYKNTWEILEKNGWFPSECYRDNNLKYSSAGDINEHFLCVYDIVSKIKPDISNIDNLKSIYSQQPNKCKLIDLGKSPTVFYLNGSIFQHNSIPHLLARQSVLIDNEFNNTLKLFMLDECYDLYKPIELKLKNEIENEQYEDPRILKYKDNYFISCANYQLKTLKYVHQKLLVLDNKFNHVGNIHPKYDGNGTDVFSNTKHQKNWTWFEYSGKFMCVYKMYPHTVLEFDMSGNCLNEYKTFEPINDTWKYGICRMGTNPVLHDGYYHNFFHSSLPWKNYKRQYFMGYYKFESTPPFKIVEISREPILYGNENDERQLKNISPLVVFPCGSICINGNFIVSYGFNDEQIGIIEI